MTEPLNHVLETQKQLRAQHAAYYRPATGDVPGEPFELPPSAPPSAALALTKTSESKEFKLFGADGFNAFDVLDMINPLQHIPLVSTIYRRLTGDELSPGARIVGATLLGGPIGAALAMADSAVEFESGKDTGANIYAALFGNEGPIPDAGTAVAAAPAAAPWQDPDLMAQAAQTVTTGGGAVAFVAASAPDLGALASYETAAGKAAAPISPEPKFVAAPWKDPDLEPLPVAVASAPKPTAPLPVAAASEQAAQQPKPVVAERPMPSDAAKAQAINALAAMPTSQTTAAVAELARAEPRATTSRHMAPPASDIPRGAGASLSRKATSAYANSMANAKPTKAEAVAAADAHNANTIAALERSTTDAQSDWMLDAMQRAMVKYEATAKLRTAANNPDGAAANANSGGISITR